MSHLNHQDRTTPPLSLSDLATQRRQELAQLAASDNLALKLFGPEGGPSEQLKSALKELGLKSPSGQPVCETLTMGQELQQLEEILQAVFFRPNQARWSYQVAEDGGSPSERQLAAFAALGMVEPITIDRQTNYDTAVVLGGTAGAVVSRTDFLLKQPVDFSTIALLGGNRKLDPDREGLELLQKYLRNIPESALPATEYEMMVAIWKDYYCKNRPELAQVDVIAINAEPRPDGFKPGPGTPETVVGMWNSLGERGSLPRSFILASSQPFAPRQQLDFVVASFNLGIRFSQCDVIGYAAPQPPSLKLYGQELAKMVHGHYLLTKGV